MVTGTIRGLWLPKPDRQCKYNFMDELKQLEVCVDSLLAQIKSLKDDHKRLNEQFEQLNGRTTVLAGEKQVLLAAVRGAESLRSEILKKIDALLQRIVEYDTIG